MPHSELFGRAARLMRVGEWAEARGISSAEALREANEADGRLVGRRGFLGAAAYGAAVLSLPGRTLAGTRAGPRIAIVGGGLAGLACADALRAKGYAATIYEASVRVGGRCFSLRGFFPGQVAERGGEFIDTTHHAMRSYAVEFGLAREDARRVDGEVLYHFGGMLWDEEPVVEEYRRLVPRIRHDTKTLSKEPTFFSHTPEDETLDAVSLRDWLATRAADLPLIRAVLDEAYVAEYGLESDEQSCLNMLLFLHADRRRKFAPFGVFSDERFHLVGGNDAIAQNIAARLPGPIVLGDPLVGMGLRGDGSYELRFASGRVDLADFVVMTLPFSVLRTLELDASLGLSADKARAIQTLGYGTNAKTMVGFQGRPWEAVGGNGSFYSDKPHVQTTWETNPSLAGQTSVLTDYAGGDRGVAIGSLPLQEQVGRFLSDFDGIVPGADAAALRTGNGDVLAFREHWPSNPLSRGGYTCYLPGQFTGIAGLEGQAAGRLKFAGEHADSFYSWQGFMEGACLSGFRAAGEVLADIKHWH